MIFDCAVVGAGPAGCAAALSLSKLGHSVALLDRAPSPRRKACGEGILPAGVAVLRELDLYDALAARGRKFHGVRHTTRGGVTATGLFSGGLGLAIAREDLDEILVHRAAAAPGVMVHEQGPVLGVEAAGDGVSLRHAGGAIRARRLIAADGLASDTLKHLNIARRPAVHARYGLSARVIGLADVGDIVEVFLIQGGEVYVTPLPGDGRANIALLLEPGTLADVAHGRDAAFWALARSHSALAARLTKARLDAPVIGLGPLAGTSEHREGALWFAAGDAAGAVDPLVGDGIGLGLRCARLAAQAVHDSLTGAYRPGRYTAGRDALIRPKARLAAAALTLSRHPALAAPAIFLLGRCPSLFTALLNE